MRSMTGYAHRLVEGNGFSAEVELRSVNNRFLKFITRLDPALAPVESRIHSILRRDLHRGTITVSVRYRPEDSLSPYRVDESAFSALLEECTRAFEKAGVYQPIDPNKLLTLDGVLESRHIPPERVERDWPALEQLIIETMADLVQMRSTEGAHLQGDLKRHHQRVGELLEQVRSRIEPGLDALQKKLSARVSHLLEGDRVPVTEADLAREIAFLAERSDICEEIERIDSHLDQFATGVENEGEIGRKLEFILQELVRETNTIGSKTTDAQTSRIVIEVKGELERLREQIQNVE